MNGHKAVLLVRKFVYEFRGNNTCIIQDRTALNVHTTMVYYSETPMGMGVVVFAKVQGEVNFESPRIPQVSFIKNLQISGEQ